MHITLPATPLTLSVRTDVYSLHFFLSLRTLYGQPKLFTYVISQIIYSTIFDQSLAIGMSSVSESSTALKVHIFTTPHKDSADARTCSPHGWPHNSSYRLGPETYELSSSPCLTRIGHRTPPDITTHSTTPSQNTHSAQQKQS